MEADIFELITANIQSIVRIPPSRLTSTINSNSSQVNYLQMIDNFRRTLY